MLNFIFLLKNLEVLDLLSDLKNEHGQKDCDFLYHWSPTWLNFDKTLLEKPACERHLWQNLKLFSSEDYA